MSRLINFLNENDNMDEIREVIQDSCYPYINDIVKSKFFPNRMLYSGRSSKNIIVRRKVRKDRKPKDTPKVVHETLDQLFYNEFGIKARSQTLFATPSGSEASNYGQVYMVFPVGRYEIIGGKLKDLYGDMVDGMHANAKSEDKGFVDVVDMEWDTIGYKPDGLDLKLANGLYDNFPVGKLYQKGNLDGALALNSEIMVYCNEWVGINEEKFRIRCKLAGMSFEQGLWYILKGN